MKQIRGSKPGAIVEDHTVSGKWLQPPHTYWIAWGDSDVRKRGDHRMNLPESVWNRYEIGDKIEIVFLETGGEPYHEDGFYASDGNFVFDYLLLAIELAMIGLAVAGSIGTVLFFRWSDNRRRKSGRMA